MIWSLDESLVDSRCPKCFRGSIERHGNLTVAFGMRRGVRLEDDEVVRVFSVESPLV